MTCAFWCGLWSGLGCYHADRQYSDGGAADGDSDSDADGEADPFSDYGCFDIVDYEDLCEEMVCDSLFDYYLALLEQCASGEQLSCLMLDVCFTPYVSCVIAACPNEEELDLGALTQCGEDYSECAQAISD